MFKSIICFRKASIILNAKVVQKDIFTFGSERVKPLSTFPRFPYFKSKVKIKPEKSAVMRLQTTDSSNSRKTMIFGARHDRQLTKARKQFVQNSINTCQKRLEIRYMTVLHVIPYYECDSKIRNLFFVSVSGIIHDLC